MAYRNATVEIAIGNVESRLLGPAPVQLLDRVLNPHLPALQVANQGRHPNLACVFEPDRAAFLTGALPQVKRALRRAGVRFRIRDLRRALPGGTGWQLDGWELRDYQREVVDEAVRVGHGIIDIGTSGGKTILAAATIARLGLPALYLVNTRTLLHQAAEALERYLGVLPGMVGDGTCDPRPLTVGLVQGITPDAPYLAQWKGGTLVFDEGHHAAARTFLTLVRAISPRYHFYLSAVPFRAGGDQVVLDALAGRSLTGRRYSAAFLVEQGYACPVEVRIEPCRITGAMHEKPFATLYQEFIADNEERNARIVAIVQREVTAGRSVLVLVERIRHGELLRRSIEEALAGSRAAATAVTAAAVIATPVTAAAVTAAAAPFASATVTSEAAGPVKPAESATHSCGLVHGKLARTHLAETTRAFGAGELPCLVATAGLFQEGVSIDGIEVLVQAGGLKSKAKVIQSVGRGMRLSPGKSACTYYDFLDDDEAGVLRGHSRRRIAALKEEGFYVAEETGPAAATADPRTTVTSAAEQGKASHAWERGHAAGAEHPGAEFEGDSEMVNGAGAGSAPQGPQGCAWFHVPGSKRFLCVDEEGGIHGRGVCLRKDVVPKKMCKKCKDKSVCAAGGKVQWQDARV